MRLEGRLICGMDIVHAVIGFGPVGSYIDLSNYYTKGEIDTAKQDKLVSGTNIKTINGNSVLGSGNINIQGGGGVQSDWNVSDASSMAYIKNKPTIPAAQVQSNWNESDNTSKAYIQNKPTIPAAQVQSDWNESDTNSKAYIQNKPTVYEKPNGGIPSTDLANDVQASLGKADVSYCPIIEDTRTSKVATITGVAPFASLTDGQRIILHTARATANNTNLKLTLSDNTETSEIPVYYFYKNGTSGTRVGNDILNADAYHELIYISSATKWYVLGEIDSNTTYANMPQSRINEGTATGAYTISPALVHDNAYIVEESYSSGSLKANKFYDFGTVSSALTIPSLDATNDLVSNALNFYAIRFISGADNLSIMFPTGVQVDDEPTINTGDYVEIMINLYVVNGTNKFYASIKVWPAQ